MILLGLGVINNIYFDISNDWLIILKYINIEGTRLGL